MAEIKTLFTTPLFKQILSLVWPKFAKNKQGLIFMEKVCSFPVKDWVEGEGDEEPFESKIFSDRTECEAFENHIHLEDELPLVGTEGLSQVATTIGEIWATKLKKDFPARAFRVYMHADSDTVVLRFHQVHPGELPWRSDEECQKEIKEGTIKIWNV